MIHQSQHSNKPFNSNNSVRVQSRVDQSPHKSELICSECGKKCSTLFNLTRHSELHNAVITRFECPKCEKTFQNKSNYSKHWTRFHNEFGTTPNEPRCVVEENKGIIYHLFFINRMC